MIKDNNGMITEYKSEIRERFIADFGNVKEYPNSDTESSFVAKLCPSTYVVLVEMLMKKATKTKPAEFNYDLFISYGERTSDVLWNCRPNHESMFKIMSIQQTNNYVNESYDMLLEYRGSDKSFSEIDSELSNRQKMI